VIGNTDTVRALRKILDRDSGDQPRVFLLEGPSGCGKTTLARIIAKEVNGEFTEIDSAQFGGVDFVRDLRKRIELRPMKADRKVWLLDECHMLSKQAQEAMLKVMEDTPEHAVLILATTEPNKLKPTLLNRCSRHRVERLTEEEIEDLLRFVIRKEDAEVSDEAIARIADTVDGSPRAALTTLDKLIGLDPEEQEALATARDEAEAEAADLCRLLFKKGKWDKVAALLASLKEKEDAEGVRRLVLAWCSGTLMKKDNPQAFIIMEAFREPFYDTGWPGLVMACYEANMEA
jgi:DNA polymerase-3 subunit gamma/tau